MGRVNAGTFGREVADPYAAEINRVVERIFVERLMELARSAAMPQVRAVATVRLQRVLERLERTGEVDEGEEAHVFLLSNEIRRFLERPMTDEPTSGIPDTPPGSPIGDTGMGWIDLRCSWSSGGW